MFIIWSYSLLNQMIRWPTEEFVKTVIMKPSLERLPNDKIRRGICEHRRWWISSWGACWLCNKKIVKFIAVIAGLFIAALAYLEYQHILIIVWTKLQTLSEDALTNFENMILQLSNNVAQFKLYREYIKFISGYSDTNGSL
jgi:uncharacterized membrane protein (Fun14 family)